MLRRTLALALAALAVLSTPCLAVYDWLRTPVPALDAVVASGGHLLGSAIFEGQPRPCSLRVEKFEEDGVLEYLLVLRVDPPPQVGGDVLEIWGPVLAESNVSTTQDGTLVIDTRGAPSNGHATFCLTLEGGSIVAARVIQHGFLGIGHHDVAADFTAGAGQAARFQALHAAR